MIDKHRRPDGTVRVRFSVPAAYDPVAVVGDFNQWDAARTPFRCAGADVMTASVVVERGRRYRFRYITSPGRQCNDEAADDYVPDLVGGYLSVVDASGGTEADGSRPLAERTRTTE